MRKFGIVLALILVSTEAHADSLSTVKNLGGGGSGAITLLGMSAVAVAAPNDTNENVVATVTIPAGTPGANGCLRWTAILTNSNNAAAKTWNVRLGGVAGTSYFSRNNANTTGITVSGYICNRNSQSSQQGALLSGMTHTGTSIIAGAVTSTINLGSASTLVFTATKATGTDTMTVESFIVEAIPQL